MVMRAYYEKFEKALLSLYPISRWVSKFENSNLKHAALLEKAVPPRLSRLMLRLDSKSVLALLFPRRLELMKKGTRAANRCDPAARSDR